MVSQFVDAARADPDDRLDERGSRAAAEQALDQVRAKFGRVVRGLAFITATEG